MAQKRQVAFGDALVRVTICVPVEPVQPSMVQVHRALNLYGRPDPQQLRQKFNKTSSHQALAHPVQSKYPKPVHPQDLHFAGACMLPHNAHQCLQSLVWQGLNLQDENGS